MMVDGYASDIFKSTRGLRQSDPVSPSSLIMVMELLRGMLIRATDLGLIKGL